MLFLFADIRKNIVLLQVQQTQSFFSPMNKETLVILLQKDISELAILSQGFGQMETIPAVLLSLAQQKAMAIVENLNAISSAENTNEQKEEKPVISELVCAPAEPIAPIPTEEPKAMIEEIPAQTAEEVVVEETQEEEIEEPLPIIAVETEDELDDEPEDETDDETEEDTDEPEEEEETPEVAEETVLEEKNQEKSEKLTRNDTIQPRISDVKQAISIGDRFLFQRELFGGNGELLSKTITAINACKTLEEAQAYISKKFNWDSESTTVERFMQIISRKF